MPSTLGLLGNVHIIHGGPAALVIQELRLGLGLRGVKGVGFAA